jgi:oxaloacetate decarboxylase gamma subunit
MMEVSLVGEAFKFMVLGMSVVLLFLVVLISLVQVQAKLIAKYFPAEEPKKASSPVTSSGPNKDMKKITAAISAALTHHNSIK